MLLNMGRVEEEKNFSRGCWATGRKPHPLTPRMQIEVSFFPIYKILGFYSFLPGHYRFFFGL